jgi:hypothetical protein
MMTYLEVEDEFITCDLFGQYPVHGANLSANHFVVKLRLLK